MCWKTEGKLEFDTARTALCQRAEVVQQQQQVSTSFGSEMCVPSCSTINRIESEYLLYPADQSLISANEVRPNVSRRISAAPGDCSAGQASSTKYGKDVYVWSVVRCVVLLLAVEMWNVMCWWCRVFIRRHASM